MRRNKKPILLNRLELQIMKILWKKGQATTREVKNELDKSRPLAYTTVATMLNYIEQKGFLTHGVSGRTHIYKPLIQQGDVSQGMLLDLMDRLFDGSVELLMTSLAKTRELTPEQLQELRERIMQHYKP